MYNFNGSRKKKRFIAIVVLVLIGAMLLTTFVSGFFLG